MARLPRFEYAGLDESVTSFGGRPVSDRLIELARRVQSQPWNASGADKTWVLDALRESQLFQREVRQARRVETR